MSEKKQKELRFTSNKARRVIARFDAGDVSSDGGLLLVREADRRLGLTRAAADCLSDKRQSGKVRHSARKLLGQRVYGLVAGYEDLNDFEQLKTDPLWQALAAEGEPIGGMSTLSRFENTQERASAVKLNRLLVDQFIDSFEKPPQRIVLDFDATDNQVHGKQEGRFFHAYYGNYCFLPLYVFCGSQLLVAYLRPSNIDAAKHAGAILKFLVGYIRERFPDTKIVFRADSGFCRHRTLGWCERHGVDYIVGLARNPRLQRFGQSLQARAAEAFEAQGCKQKLFGELSYAAGSWKRRRRVIHKAEHTDKGANPRFVVTTLTEKPEWVYRQYCKRGEMENKIKEQMMLYSDRTSAHLWWANQWRVLLSALAYVLLDTIRRLALKGTELEKATVRTIQLKLVKIGCLFQARSARYVIRLSAACPFKGLFERVAARLRPT
jgi:hypothetical protein